MTARHASDLKALFALLLVILMAACQIKPAADSSALQTEVFQAALLTATYSVNTVPSATNTPVPTPTEANTPTPATPPELPAAFSTDLLRPESFPESYENNTCQYLLNKWDPNKSQPGTIVMPIMFHSITDGVVTDDNQISVETFKQLIHDLREQNFEAISMQQFTDFMLNNGKIPARSVLLIVDDRKTRQYFETHFRDLYNEYSWVVINAWISFPETTRQLWDENAALEQEGFVDHQAHGVIHNINMTADQSDEFIRNELYGSIDAMQQHFNKTPSAIIWPGGSFCPKSIQFAQEAGYKVGFTVNPRGPVLYNWIPLNASREEGQSPWLQDSAMNAPLLVIPRYWDTDASFHLDTVRQISSQAAEYAEKNKSIELEYYQIVCEPELGPVPTLQP